MSLFSKLPIKVADFTLPQVARNDIGTFTEAEFGAYDHWIFDKNSSAGLTGIANGKVLTQGDVSPTYGNNFLSVTNGPGDGLLTDLSDTDLDEVTLWAVIRQPVADGTNGNRFFFGSSTGSAGIGGIVTGSSTTLTATARMAASGNPYAVGTTSVNTWFFFAMSCRLITGALAVRAKLANETVDSYTPLAGVTRSGLDFSLGNYHFATGPAAATFQFAEFGILETLLSATELDGLYTRSQTRMALRGITI